MLGRTRLRVPALQWWPDLAIQLEAYLRDQPGIAAVYTVPACASVTVTYDPTSQTPQTVRQLLTSLSLYTLRKYQSTRRVVPVSAPPGSPSWNGLLLSSTALVISLAAPPLTLLLLPLLAGSAWPMLSRAYTALMRQQQLNVDVLDASALTLLTLQ